MFSPQTGLDEVFGESIVVQELLQSGQLILDDRWLMMFNFLFKFPYLCGSQPNNCFYYLIIFPLLYNCLVHEVTENKGNSLFWFPQHTVFKTSVQLEG